MRFLNTSPRGLRGTAGVVVLLITATASSARAQTRDTTKTPPVRDTTTRVQPRPPLPIRSAIVPALRPPPITPKRAFLYSLMIPGLGQARLDRGTAGALFAAVELGSWAMVRKSTSDLRVVRRYSEDSLPDSYLIGADGKTITKVGSFGSEFPVDLVSTRRLHREDWFAALIFNHLISGADAFVAAQLWDVNRSVTVKPYRDGAALVATIRW